MEVTSKLVDKLYNECIEFANSIMHKDLQECCIGIYTQYCKQIKNAPCSTGSHHAYPGGLLVHTHHVTRNALMIAEAYPEVHCDHDLIIFGGLLHDIGKIQTYSNSDYRTDIDRAESRHVLLGHTYCGVQIVEQAFRAYDIDPLLRDQALHMIGSHMNAYDHGGQLVTPKMIEVRILNMADGIDAYLEPTVDVLSNVSRGEEYHTTNLEGNLYRTHNPFF